MKHHNGESGLKMDGADVVETDLNLALGTPSSHDKTVADNTRGVATDDSFSNDAIDYPTSTRLLMINLSLCISIFVTALDNTIIATAIPRITDDFKSQNDIGWYGSSYLLTQASLQLLYGKFYTMTPIKCVFVSAIGIFELGSLICAVAPNSAALICGRAIAGLGAAGISSGAVIIITHSVPVQKRPMYTGLIGAMYGIASVAGPLLGGAFADKATWRWCFYINLPIGGIAVLLMLFFLKLPHRPLASGLTWRQRIAEFDLVGTIFFLPSIICLLLALQWGGTTYSWTSWRIILLLVIFAVLFIIWIIIQYWMGDAATVPSRLLMKRSIAAAAWFNFTMGSAFLVLIYYLPIWFQAVKSTSAVVSGIYNLPLILGLVLVSILIGIGVTVVGYYAPFMIAASAITSIAIGLMTTFTPGSAANKWIGYQAMAGIGIGFGLQQPLVVVQTVLPLSDVPIGTALMYFLQVLGGSIFVSVGQNIFTNKLKATLLENVPGLDPDIVLSAGATSFQHSVAPKYLPLVISAYNDAITRAFLVATLMACLTIMGSLLVEWKNVKAIKKSSENKKSQKITEKADGA
ncbi:hypothetical protein H634G_09924 [Metarhizium anisopliae BRIP 53293]|uniref:Major facilitator superfamily (MFS) profile domain-containing protein n=1 Tax=Metarhizium anisopliae BRIP 53293 TaxID=1291518 RepID=A0A0D9NQH4_METAN|nr:hypothetical protein H634G_09924 [Metarhizium anisopliae BRIP 53293]KJK94805.1 hypothetical protein H633G_01315 [Metarhizium anisopliae BRIP 53284]